MSQYYESSSYPMPPRNHPQATTILVLGILGLLLCGVLGPFAWSMGNKALREIDASQGQLAGRETVNIGRILGIITTVLLVLGIVVLVAFVVLGLAVGVSTSP